MNKEMGKDWPWVKFKLANVVTNGIVISLSQVDQNTNQAAYSLVGKTIIPLEKFKKHVFDEVLFMVESGSLGADGIDARLYDKTNAAEITLINFLGTEDDTIKTAECKSYFQALTDNFIVVELQFRKAGPIGPSSISTGAIGLFGKEI